MPRKSKRRPKEDVEDLPDEIVVLRNKDKDGWGESWDYPKNRSLGLLPHPFRLLALGSVGRGKTNTIKNLFLKHQASAKPFQRLFIITCSENSQEWVDCDPDDILEQIPPLEIFTDDTSQKTCVIIDDYEFAASAKIQIKRLTTLFRYVSSHCNVSIFCSYQNFFSVPQIVRRCANSFLIYKPNSKLEITTLSNRVGINDRFLKNLFKKECSGPYDSVLVDLSINTPAKIRKNIYEPIEYDSDND